MRTNDRPAEVRDDHEPTWRFITVQGRTTKYATAGTGDPVVLLHGWTPSDRHYRVGVARLVAAGAAVHLPALPGFGGTPHLPPEEVNLEGYARWVSDFVAAAGIESPVTLIGHSFGGGVALRLTHDHPALVARLILVNSIGKSTWPSGSVAGPHPFWDWGFHLPDRAAPAHLLTRVLPVVLADAALNAVRSPQPVRRLAKLARDADLAEQLDAVRNRRLPVFVLWGREDRVIPLAASEALFGGSPGVPLLTAPGEHGWLISDLGLYAEVMTNVLGPAGAEATGARSVATG